MLISFYNDNYTSLDDPISSNHIVNRSIKTIKFIIIKDNINNNNQLIEVGKIKNRSQVI